MDVEKGADADLEAKLHACSNRGVCLNGVKERMAGCAATLERARGTIRAACRDADSILEDGVWMRCELL